MPTDDNADERDRTEMSKDRTRGRGSLPLIAAFLAGVVLVALVAAGVAFFQQSRHRGDQLAAQNQAADAACRFAHDTNTYDYTGNLDDFLDRMKREATDTVTKPLADTWQPMRQLLTQAQVKASVQNVACGFQSGDADNAKILVTLSLLKTNSVTPTPKRQDIAVIAGMIKQGDTWLVDKWDLAMLAPGPDQSGADQPAPGGAPQPAAPQPGDQQPQGTQPAPGATPGR
jgi:Mce-associated membrane protein